MEEGECDALLLAYAGAHRMGYNEMIVAKLDTAKFIPAVGQGSVAVECSTELNTAKKETIRALTNHPETEIQLLAERAFLRKLEGGCSIPVFALAQLQHDKVILEGGIISLDGKEKVLHKTYSSTKEPELAGEELADKVLDNGGDVILNEIKTQLNK